MTAFEDADWISLAKTPFTMQRPISTPYMSHQTGTSLAWIAVRRAMWNHWVSTVPRRLYPHHLLPPLRVLYDTLFPTPRRHRALFSRLLLPTIPRIQAFCDAPPYRSRRRKIPYFMLIPIQTVHGTLLQRAMFSHNPGHSDPGRLSFLTSSFSECDPLVCIIVTLISRFLHKSP